MKPLVKKRISFSIFNEADFSSKQFTVSQTIFLLTVLSVFAAVCLTGFIAVRCNTLHRTIPPPALLEEASSNQRHLVSSQTQQIRLLNEKINGLTNKFEQLQAMKNEICKIGRIEQPVNHENLFGIGGSRAEEMAKPTDVEKDSSSGNGIDTAPPDINRQKSIAFNPTAANGRMLILDHSSFYINPIACVPSSLPMNGIIAEGPRQSQPLISGQTDFHHGVLLKAVQGDEIMTPANGIIAFVDVNNDSKNTVIIDHGHGYVTRYACLESVTKELGELVLKGDVIGHAKSGPSETPSQFYYEIILNGLPVNPEKYTAHDPFLL